MIIAVLAIAIQLAAPPPVPPPVEQFTANCSTPVYASDLLVCQDSVLRELDSSLTKKLAAVDVPVSTVFFEGNGQWFKRRSLCAFEKNHRTCLQQAYSDRLRILDALSLSANSPKAVSCKGFPDILKATIGAASNGILMLYDEHHKNLIGIASVQSPGLIWKPLLTVETKDMSYRFHTQSGLKFSCRVNDVDRHKNNNKQ
jgi:uncharacterized protein